ncbi:hypothetical protein E3N88_07669 [Mikania micrantha]|uniref:PGG domain-containing protein n=1 Tax=Mikania micrantha TaxID=192012 RepID=A0A5N6PE53_9ASTR|nr:hypothetical protein E3N88_07669 [Mikania micrantha]
MESSSSSNPENPYPYPSHVTMKLSGRDTYDVWKTQMMCLLKSHDMIHSNQLKTLDGRPDELVKGWILGSLSNQTLKYLVNSFPNQDFTAKDAWDKLQTIYGPLAKADKTKKLRRIDTIEETAKTDEEKKEAQERKAKKNRSMEALHAAILDQDYGDVIEILDEEVVTLRDKITITSNTALHVAVGTGKNRKFLKRMLKLATKDNQQSLDMRNSEGSTLLHVAAIVGNTEATKMLVERNPDMLYEKDNEGQTPIDRALSNMHTDTYMYLLDEYLKSQDPERGDGFDNSEILINAISSKDYDSALKMARLIRDPDTLLTTIGESVLTAIAQNFPPKLNFLERHMMLLFSHVPATFKFVEAAQRKAEAYSDAIRLLCFTCDSITTSTTCNNAIFEATRQNAVEVVKIIVSRFPNAIWSSNEDGHNIIQYAVINRSEKIYSLLYQMSEHKNIYRTIKDPFKNNLLHLAARLAPENKLNPISGAALQIQRELQWFMEVESFVCPLNVIQKNSFGETPQMVFTKEHKKLLIEGEKWMKETAQSYTITATLITTIVFAAAITVPGGNKQDNGIPIFTNNIAFTVFAVSNAISFFTSITSLLMFLSILTARFSEQDFRFKLPIKLIIGLANLFISTTAMLVAFGATLFLVFSQNNSWILAPIATLTCLPITSFMTLQFPLIYDLISATYVRSMFGKKSDDPFY